MTLCAILITPCLGHGNSLPLDSAHRERWKLANAFGNVARRPSAAIKASFTGAPVNKSYVKLAPHTIGP